MVQLNAFGGLKIQKVILTMLILVTLGTSAFSQDRNMENKIETAKALGKESIIEKAKYIFKTKYPALKIDFSDFEITTWVNSEKIVANFKRSIKFITLKNEAGDLTYHFSINIETEAVTPLDYSGSEKFYIATEEDSAKLVFVKKAFNLPHAGFENTVVEKANMYEIMIDNDVAFGRYYIDKTTGKELTDLSIEGSYAPAPFPEAILSYPLIEITN